VGSAGRACMQQAAQKCRPAGGEVIQFNARAPLRTTSTQQCPSTSTSTRMMQRPRAHKACTGEGTEAHCWLAEEWGRGTSTLVTPPPSYSHSSTSIQCNRDGCMQRRNGRNNKQIVCCERGGRRSAGGPGGNDDDRRWQPSRAERRSTVRA
jgi:hypothetical protein